MRAQDTIYREVASYSVVNGQLVGIDLNRDLDYARLDIRLEGTVTVTGTTGTSVQALAPLQLLQNVNLTVNGSKQLCNAPGRQLYNKNRWQNRGIAPALTPPSAATAADYTVAANVFVDQCMIDGVNPKDSQLPSNTMSSFRLNVQIGNVADLFVGAPAGTFSGTLTVSAVQVKEYMGPGADGKVGRYTPSGVQYYDNISLQFAGAQSNFQQILLTNVMHRMLVLFASISGAPSDAVLNSIRLERGGNTLATITGAEIKAIMQASMPTVPTGLYVLDPARAFGQALAKITDGYDMRAPGGGVSEQLYLYLDVEGGSGYQVEIGQNYFEDFRRFFNGA
jgi:hypothetical protein